MRRFVFSTLIVIIAIVAMIAWLLLSPLPVAHSRVIKVTPGTQFEQLVQGMTVHGNLGNTLVAPARQLLMASFARTTGLARHLHVGEYPLRPGDNLVAVLRRLQNADILHHAFTLVDGWDFRQVRQALRDAPSLEHKLAGMTDAQVAKVLHLKQTKVEGWLAPDTYFYTLGDTDLSLLKRACQHQQQLLTRLWKKRSDNLPYHSPYQALIMASLVEKETAVKSEMPKIAGVFVSRLRKGMRLQTDPTVIYAMGKSYHGKITYQDLEIKSPYNTYLHTGLPPGPIAMPSRLAITAAMHPKVTGALYFVAKGDGTHVFSRTLAAHNAAVRQYQLHRSTDYRSTPETRQ